MWQHQQAHDTWNEGYQNYQPFATHSFETTPANRITKLKATNGLYKRLKKEVIDLDETARKVLTGGKVDTVKIENRRKKLDEDHMQRFGMPRTVRHNTYTEM